MQTDDKVQKKQHFWRDKFSILIIGLIFIGSSGLTYSQLNPGKYNPFGNYPPQVIVAPAESHILDRTSGADISLPTIHVLNGDEKVTVSARKCIKGNHDVEVKGQVVWHNLVPNGFFSEPKLGAGTRHVGDNTTLVDGQHCEDFTFRMNIPTEILNRINSIKKDEKIDVTEWDIRGEETPSSTSNSVTQDWKSIPFLIVDDR